MSEYIEAPWTPEQVEGLRRWQNHPGFHPYTCANRSVRHPMDPEGDHGVLVPTEDGWVCRHCDYTQKWAHSFSVLGEYYVSFWDRPGKGDE